jgi:transketolase C-terminal domain/subunit
MHIFAPGSSYEFETLFEKTWNNGFPKYFKLIADQHSEEFEVEPYKCNILQKSSDSEVVIFVSGFLLDVVLKTNSNSTVVYVPTISPMEKASRENIVELVKNHKAALVVEENSLIGGLGDQIFHIISEAGLSAKIKKIGIPNQFLEEYGKADQHREHIGLTMEDISKAIWDIRDA